MTTPVDSLGMLEAVAGLPEQIESAIEVVKGSSGFPAHDDIENVVVLGMGGSGIAGDFASAIAGPFMPVPVVTQKGYAPPQFVDEHSLVFAVSFSGDTEEILEAASMAAMDGGRMVVVAAGGELASLAASWGAVHIPVDATIPMPRAALGALVVPPLLVLEQVGLFPGAHGWIEQAVTQLRRRRDELLADGNAAAGLARRLVGQVPILYGGGAPGSIAASRWKNQFNENAKVPAFASTVPELMHNEICGWTGASSLGPELVRLVDLRHDLEHPQIARRFALIAEALDGAVSGVEEVWAEGEGSLAKALDLAMFGDFTSTYLAYELGVDPGPVPLLDEIKRRLAVPD